MADPSTPCTENGAELRLLTIAVLFIEMGVGKDDMQITAQHSYCTLQVDRKALDYL